MEAARFAWIPTYTAMLVVGGLTVLFLHLITPPRLLRYTGVWPFCSPNWISILRVPVTLIGLGMYFHSQGDPYELWVGYELTVLGMYLDRLDGKVAKSLLSRLTFLPDMVLITPDGQRQISSPRVLTPPLTSDYRLWAWYETEEKINGQVAKVQRRVLVEDWIHRLTKPATVLPMFELNRSEDPAYPGLRLQMTRLGGCIDPGSDKFCFITVLIYMLLNSLVFSWMAVLMILSDLFSTVMRWPFDRVPVFRLLQRWVVEEKASSLGKTKVIWQILTMLSIMPAAAAWLQPGDLLYSRIITSSLLGLAVVTGILSNLSRMSVWHSVIRVLGLENANRNFKQFFDHKVAE
jgi:phosphatidylglycerophosphate synthase